jgi:glycosyltransferase involved in cell wall biosynthesis
MRKLAVIPIESVADSRRKGLTNYASYLNPGGIFNEVIVLSPFEGEVTNYEGLRVIPTREALLPARLKELHIDVVRAYGGGSAADMACYHRLSGIPVVVSVHDQRPEMLHPSVAFADVVFCVAPHVRDMVLGIHRRPERVWLRPNGVDLERMKPLSREECRQGIGWDQSAKYILHVGRRTPDKNLKTLIEAIAELPVDWNLVAAGSGDVEPLLDVAKRAGVTLRCRFLDTVPNSILPAFYSAADCFCLPSLEEAMSNVVLEAFACGCPAVLSAAAALGVGVSDGKEAVVVTDPQSPSRLAGAIRKVVEDQEFASGLVREALGKARLFEREAMEEREMEHYDRILAMKEAGEFSLGPMALAGLYFANLRWRTMHKSSSGQRQLMTR